MATPQLVCVVDDQDDYRFLLQQVFRRYLPDYSTYFFASGRALLEKLAELDPPPCLIILDRHMPLLDGHQTLVHLKEHTTFKKIPVVMMSADASSHEIDGCYEAGVNSFLSKGMDFDSIRETIIRLCTYWLEVNQFP